MTTKRSAKSCKVPATRSIPSKIEYEKAKLAAAAAAKRIDHLRASATGKAGALPAMHQYPAWGAPCFVQAYAEMLAVQTLATAYTAWLNQQAVISTSSPSVSQAIYSSFLTAQLNYITAWGTMEDCLKGYPV